MCAGVYVDIVRPTHVARRGVGEDKRLVLEISVLKVGRKLSMWCSIYLVTVV